MTSGLYRPVAQTSQASFLEHAAKPVVTTETVTAKQHAKLFARAKQAAFAGWCLGLVVASWSRSTKLLYAGPG